MERRKRKGERAGKRKVPLSLFFFLSTFSYFDPAPPFFSFAPMIQRDFSSLSSSIGRNPTYFSRRTNGRERKREKRGNDFFFFSFFPSTTTPPPPLSLSLP